MVALQAQIVLACAGPDVPPIVVVARDLRVAADAVRKWCRRTLAWTRHVSLGGRVADLQDPAEEFRDPDSPLWGVRFEDPMGVKHHAYHETVLRGLSTAVYTDDAKESAPISTWVQDGREAKAGAAPCIGAFPVVQLGLFSDAAVRFPYQGHNADTAE